ncbi:MAG: ATP-dependent dethiobiotin synthetase BioD [Elusimicrobia bacterium]|nr:ATP-dependent dethiobiotin synthetase BioD [Elusimicrobiota bacterium]
MGTEAFVVAGTDTGVGKTTFAAMLTLALDGFYWKPVQAGSGGSGAARGTDTERVRRLTGLPPERFLPEAWRLDRPVSPHRAAELSGARVDLAVLSVLPRVGRPLVVELAGGLLVPLTRSVLQADLVARWRAPVVLCARTALGTINHTLLSVEALRARGISILGAAFVGDAEEDSERTICDFARVRRLGRLPRLETLGPATLRAAFAENFSRADFAFREAAA